MLWYGLRENGEMMKSSLYVDEAPGTPREVEVLQGRGMTISERCRKIGMPDNTNYGWKKEYGGLNLEQAVPQGHTWGCQSQYGS